MPEPAYPLYDKLLTVLTPAQVGTIKTAMLVHLNWAEERLARNDRPMMRLADIAADAKALKELLAQL